MKGIIGKKLGMTSVFNEDGKMVTCTVVQAGPCVVTQVKTKDTDGYDAVQLGMGEKPEKSSNKPQVGHFKKAKTGPKKKLIEFTDYFQEVNAGDTINCDIFEEGEVIAVTGRTKGKGFQGVVKRHGFKGVGMATHGQHNRLRAPGSIGMASTPARVFKGMKMGGQTGNARRTTSNLNVVKVIADKNILLIKGSVPGPKGGYLIIAN